MGDQGGRKKKKSEMNISLSYSAQKDQTEELSEMDPVNQTHVLSSPFSIQNFYSNGSFQGKVLTRVIKGGRKKNQDSSRQLGVIDESVTETAFVGREDTIQLRQFFEYFGYDNFFNIFRCFYELSRIPTDAENNVFKFFIEKESILRGFE
jgi:hypothetical protein